MASSRSPLQRREAQLDAEVRVDGIWAAFTGPLPWDRQETDTDLSFAAFTAYLEQGSRRSFRRLHDELYPADATGSSPDNHRTIERWSSENDWRQRVEAFDDWVASE